MQKQKKVSGKTLEDYFKVYADKSPEWLIKQLFVARCRAHEAKNRVDKLLHEFYRRESRYDEDKLLREANARLADVLQLNGIRPKKLEITYRETYCRQLSVYSEYICEESECDICDECVTGTFIESFSVYDYAISDEGVLNAIDYKMQGVEREVIKVVDVETGRVIYQRMEATK